MNSLVVIGNKSIIVKEIRLYHRVGVKRKLVQVPNHAMPNAGHVSSMILPVML